MGNSSSKRKSKQRPLKNGYLNPAELQSPTTIQGIPLPPQEPPNHVAPAPRGSVQGGSAKIIPSKEGTKRVGPPSKWEADNTWDGLCQVWPEGGELHIDNATIDLEYVLYSALRHAFRSGRF